MKKWLLYGAYGYTGILILEEALARGHRPVLAGRNAAKVAHLGEKYNLEWLALDLDYQERLDKTVAHFDAVLHAAGPFVHTSDPMVRACLAGNTHYLDITGEIPVFENTFSYAREALQQEVALISGVGFDIVPTDCPGKYVAGQVDRGVELEIAFAALGGVSAGNTRTMLEMLPTIPGGGMVRRNGRLTAIPLGQGKKTVRFSNGKAYNVLPVPWGDVVTAMYATGIPNITCAMAFPDLSAMTAVAPFFNQLLSWKPVSRLARTIVEQTVTGPDEHTRQTARSYIWARAANAHGQEAQAWLETSETYRFTAMAAVRALEKVLDLNPSGALTPSMAFGTEFVLEIEGTQRFDNIP